MGLLCSPLCYVCVVFALWQLLVDARGLSDRQGQQQQAAAAAGVGAAAKPGIGVSCRGNSTQLVVRQRGLLVPQRWGWSWSWSWSRSWSRSWRKGQGQRQRQRRAAVRSAVVWLRCVVCHCVWSLLLGSWWGPSLSFIAAAPRRGPCPSLVSVCSFPVGSPGRGQPCMLR